MEVALFLPISIAVPKLLNVKQRLVADHLPALSTKISDLNANLLLVHFVTQPMLVVIIMQFARKVNVFLHQ